MISLHHGIKKKIVLLSGERNDCMIFYHDRIKIRDAYYEWLQKNADVKDCIENLIAFMSIEGLLKDRTECDFYDRQIIKLFKEESQEEAK